MQALKVKYLTKGAEKGTRKGGICEFDKKGEAALVFPPERISLLLFSSCTCKYVPLRLFIACCSSSFSASERESANRIKEKESSSTWIH